MFQTLVSADESSVVRVWNLNTGQAITRFTDAHVNAKGEPVKITSTMFDRTHRRLVTGAHDGSIKLWNFSTGAPLKEFVGFGEGEVTGLACMHMTPYDYMLAAGWNRKVSFWLDPHSLPADKAATMPKLQPQHHMHGPKEDILCMACYPEMHLLVTGAYDGDIIIWNLETGHAKAHLVLPGIASLKTDQKPIEAMQLAGIRTNFLHKFPPKTKKHDNIVVLLFTASGDGIIRVWSTGVFLNFHPLVILPPAFFVSSPNPTHIINLNFRSAEDFLDDALHPCLPSPDPTFLSCSTSDVTAELLLEMPMEADAIEVRNQLRKQLSFKQNTTISETAIAGM